MRKLPVPECQGASQTSTSLLRVFYDPRIRDKYCTLLSAPAHIKSIAILLTALSTLSLTVIRFERLPWTRSLAGSQNVFLLLPIGFFHEQSLKILLLYKENNGKSGSLHSVSSRGVVGLVHLSLSKWEEVRVLGNVSMQWFPRVRHVNVVSPFL